VLVHDLGGEAVAPIAEGFDSLKSCSSTGASHRSHGMYRAIERDAPTLIPSVTIDLNSCPCSSSSPDAFTNRFPKASRVMLLKATIERWFFTTKGFPFPSSPARLIWCKKKSIL
jgi:hypothetical protein